MTRKQFADLIRRADEYILALRQVIYSGVPEVRKQAEEQLNGSHTEL